MPDHDRIHGFLKKARARLEQVRLIKLTALALLGVSLALLLWCLAWVWRGYAAPVTGYLLAGLALLVWIAVGAWLRRTSMEKTAALADRHFGLKDALMSFLGFAREQREGDFEELHAGQTARRVQGLNVGTIPLVWPKRMLAAAGVMLAASALLGSRDASPAVKERLLLEEETSLRTEEINQELEKQIDELLKQADDEEKALLKPDEWRQWVKELEQTRDRKEAMRQYAELERKMQEAALKLSQREQEQLLAKAGEEMKEQAELRDTGRKLEEKNYREAAADLQKLSLKADVKRPDEARKELAKLKAAAQRMAAAAKDFQQRSGKQGSGAQTASASRNAASNSAKSGQQSGADGRQGSSGNASMDAQMAALDAAAQQYDKALQQMPGTGECRSAQQLVNQRLDKLCQSLGQCATKRDLMKKLMALSQCAGKCQGFLCNKEGLCLAQCLGQKPGGKNAGSGSVESRRNELDLTQDNGRRDQLQGTKGSGPANTSVEAADSGTGTASRQAKVAERTWQRQVEAFVQREDVPAEVKNSVKEYFKGIQQVGE